MHALKTSGGICWSLPSPGGQEREEIFWAPGRAASKHQLIAQLLLAAWAPAPATCRGRSIAEHSRGFTGDCTSRLIKQEKL